jgi:hypothetical protein
MVAAGVGFIQTESVLSLAFFLRMIFFDLASPPSGLREGRNPVAIPGRAEDKLFGITR